MNDDVSRGPGAQPGGSDHGFTPADVWYLLKRRWRVVAAGAALGLLAALLIALLTPRVFRAEAKLLVRYVADTTALDPGAAQGRVLTPDARGENIINSEIEIFANRDSVEKVVARVGLDRFPMRVTNGTQQARAVRTVLENLHIDVPKRSNIIKAYFDAPSPDLAIEVLGRLVEAYLDKHLQVHRSGAAYDFLSQQTDQSRSRLAETEEELRKAKNEAGVVSLRESQVSLMARVDELRRARDEAEAELAATRAKLRVLDPSAAPAKAGAAAGTPRAVPRDERLTRLEARETELLSTYTTNSIPVLQIRAQLAELRRALAAGGEAAVAELAGVDAGVVPEQAGLAATEARIGVLQNQLRDALEDVQRLDRLENRIVQLERNREIQEENYRSFVRSLEQARINDVLDAGKISNISLVQPAMLVAANHRPNLWQNVALVIVLGLALGVAAALALEWIPGRRVRRARDVEHGLQLPALLAVPRAGDGAPPGDAAALPRVGALQPYCEALGDRLMHALGSPVPSPCLIGLVACRPGAGVTTLASGLAVALAQHHAARVLLLEPEPSAGTRGRLPGVPPSRGALDVRADAQGGVTVVEHNLFVLGAERQEAAPTASLVRRWPDLLQRAEADGYRFVVLDLPVLSPVSTALRLVSQLHATVLVVEADRDRWSAARQGRDLLLRSGARIAGAVLNKVPAGAAGRRPGARG